MQADVCDFDSLRSAITSIQTLYGPIENIVHTAAVVSDATIQTVTDESFELVLRPKVIGAWNLHTVSEELKLPLKTFVLLSSVRLVFHCALSVYFFPSRPVPSLPFQTSHIFFHTVFRLGTKDKLLTSLVTHTWRLLHHIGIVYAFLLPVFNWEHGNPNLFKT